MSASSVRALLFLLLAMLVGCATGPSIPYETDVVPGFDAETLACVAVVSERDSGLGSAVRVAPNRLLTARHVADALRHDAAGTFEFRIDGELVTGRVVAQGDVDAPHGDWALIEVDGAAWPPERIAELHAPCAAPDWRPAPGTNVVLAGYASNFFPNRRLRLPTTAPTLASRVIDAGAHPEDAEEAWFLAPNEFELAGLSGGAVFLRTLASKRPELIGVYTGTTTYESALEGPFGLKLSVRKESAHRFVRLPAALFER